MNLVRVWPYWKGCGRRRWPFINGRVVADVDVPVGGLVKRKMCRRGGNSVRVAVRGLDLVEGACVWLRGCRYCGECGCSEGGSVVEGLYGLREGNMWLNRKGCM